MKDIEKAKIILKGLDKYIQVNWNAEEYFIAGILEGIEKVRELEKKEGNENV